MRLTQRETDALIRAWREQSNQPLSPATNARLTAIVRALQDHDPAAMRKWLVHGGDIGAHFGTVSRAIEAKAKANTTSQARVLATDIADSDALDHTVAAPFFIDDLLEETPRNAPPPTPQSPLRTPSRTPATTQHTTLTVDRSPDSAPWQAKDDELAGEPIRYPEWRKVAAVCFAVATLVSQTALMVALISAAFAWQTGASLSSDWFLPLGVACASVALAWVCHRTFARFQSISDFTGLPVTAPRLIKLTLIPIVVGATLALLSELGPPLLAGTGLTGALLTVAILAVALLCNTAYCHTVPKRRIKPARTRRTDD